VQKKSAQDISKNKSISCTKAATTPTRKSVCEPMSRACGPASKMGPRQTRFSTARVTASLPQGLPQRDRDFKPAVNRAARPETRLFEVRSYWVTFLISEDSLGLWRVLVIYLHTRRGTCFSSTLCGVTATLPTVSKLSRTYTFQASSLTNPD